MSGPPDRPDVPEIDREPTSLVDDPTSPELARLVAAARDDPGLDAQALERVVQRAASPPAVGGGPGVLLALGALAIALVVGVAAWRALTRAPRIAPAAAPTQPARAPDRGDAPPTALENPLADPPPASTREEPRAEAPPEPAESGRSAQRGAARAPTEGSLLLRARSALRDDPVRALAISDEHLRLYPDGTMSEEREALAIEALAALHRADALSARAERFGRAYPHSPYAARVRAALARATEASRAP